MSLYTPRRVTCQSNFVHIRDMVLIGMTTIKYVFDLPVENVTGPVNRANGTVRVSSPYIIKINTMNNNVCCVAFFYYYKLINLNTIQ